MVITHVYDIETINNLVILPLKVLIGVHNSIETRDDSNPLQFFIFLLRVVDLLVEFNLLKFVQIIDHPHLEVTDVPCFVVTVIQLKKPKGEDWGIELEYPNWVLFVGLVQADDVRIREGEHIWVVHLVQFHVQYGFVRDVPLEDVNFVLCVEHLDLLFHCLE